MVKDGGRHGKYRIDGMGIGRLNLELMFVDVPPQRAGRVLIELGFAAGPASRYASSARVSLWRRLRASGAASLANGAWALPASKAHGGLFERLAATTREQGGSAIVFHGGISQEQRNTL